MSGVPRRSPSRNKSKPTPIAPNSNPKPSAKLDKPLEQRSKDPCTNARPLVTSLSAPSALRRQDLLLGSNLSLNASCSSDASTDSFCSRASTGRIGRGGLMSRRRQMSVCKPEKVAAKLERAASDNGSKSDASVEASQGGRRCAWVTTNTDPRYVAFHDEEWGVPVHDDKKLFELLVLSGALAELTWPVILSKRNIFREVFMDFDPMLVSKLNEKKIVAPGSTARSLLSEPKLRAIIENAHQIFKVIEEFGSFDQYCWSFVNHKPIVSRFRYARQVPVKTPKADAISKDLVWRGFRSVGPTVIYSFMQAAGLTNDHLITCFRFEDCVAAATSEDMGDAIDLNANNNHKAVENMDIDEEVVIVDVELSRAVSKVSVL